MQNRSPHLKTSNGFMDVSLPRTHYLNSAVCWIKHWGVQLPRTSLPLSMLNHILIQ